MIPSWVINSLIVVVGGILACYIGSYLPSENDYVGFYILGVAVICTIAMVTNNFPALLAVGMWMPFALPLPVFSSFPTIGLIMAWISVVLFFRLCLYGTIYYVRSFNLLFLICFAWVPVRFLMNPIHKLGANVEGGSGVSGATPYFLYVLSAFIIILVGAVLNTRPKLISFMHWCLLMVLVDGLMFLTCAFLPSTAPFFYKMGVFAAGNMGDNIVRFVQLPAYGFFIMQACLCPNLFKMPAVRPSPTGWTLNWRRIPRFVRFVLFFIGLLMLIIGGNRSTVTAAMCALPWILLIRRRTHLLLICAAFAGVGIFALRFSVDQMPTGEISPFVRAFGMFDSRINEASGGNSTTDWRYQVWRSGIEKIMESPIVGKGFGNLPKHLDPTATEVMQSTDFEVILAGGEAHNGFITAAYGFGIPFMALLTMGILYRFFHTMRMGFRVDRHDLELRDFYALIVSLMVSALVNIYAAFDMSITTLWMYISIGFVLDRLPRATDVRDPALGDAGTLPGQYGGYYAGPYSYGAPRAAPKRR